MKNITSTQKEDPNTVWDRLIASAPSDKSKKNLHQVRAPRITPALCPRYTHKPVYFEQNHLGRGCPND